MDPNEGVPLIEALHSGDRDTMLDILHGVTDKEAKQNILKVPLFFLKSDYKFIYTFVPS